MEKQHYISHTAIDGRREEINVHLTEVAEMAASFADGFGGADLAYLAGMAHDVGKYSSEFQDRLLHDGHRIDHSTAGAYELFKRGLPESLLSYCVAGHHGGLPDGGNEKSDGVDDPTLIGRMKRAAAGKIPFYRAWVEEITLSKNASYTPMSTECSDDGFVLSFLIRMIYSCLVDADYLCTERFMEGHGRADAYASIDALAKRLEDKTKAFYPPTTKLNALRCGLLSDCCDAARKAPGFFTLTAPTGSGKTIASSAFGVLHAKEHGLERVIYAIPYTSIIEQNARVFRDIFGDSNVLEAHSNVSYEEDGESEDEPSRMRLASENWDAPIVVTTNVQFFESFYSCKPSRNRKLHNIANSVIILDEAQTLPVDRLLPCIRVLCELVLRYGCTVVFCTATQPVLSDYLGSYCCKATEIVADPVLLAEQLQRVTYRYIGKLTDDDLACRIKVHEQVLCVVNSRKQARAIFDLVGGGLAEEGVYHLSTCMHPAHREATLDAIRQRLDNHLPCQVISTSLIEAGVDIDFPVVYRAVAGADSIVQAAGRCNRNGTSSSKGIVYVFSEDENDDGSGMYPLPFEVNRRAKITMGQIRGCKAGDDAQESNDRVSRYMESNKFTDDYFRLLCENGRRDMDKGGALKAMSSRDDLNHFKFAPFAYPFRTVSENFSLIENITANVVYPDQRIADVLQRMGCGDIRRGDVRKLMRYAVGMYPSDIESLGSLGAIKLIAEGIYELLNPDLYDEHVGLRADGAGGQAVMY